MALRKLPTTKASPGKVVDFNPFDPEQVNTRLYHQVSALLAQIEEKDSRSKITIRERVQALVAIGRLQQVFAALRKASPHDSTRGATVKKYATAFSANATGRGDAHPRSGTRAEPEPTDWFERDEFAPAGDDAFDGDPDSDDAAE